MAALFNLARMTVSSTGTGNITLSAAVSGFLTFDLAGCSTAAAGQQVSYAISDNTQSEIGLATYISSSLLLSGRTPNKSTNSNNAIDMSNAAQVFITPRAEDLYPVPVANGGTGATSVSVAQTNLSLVGKQMIPVPASAMTARPTNGAQFVTIESTTNLTVFNAWNFDATTQEYVQFSWPMPTSWDRGTITFKPMWRHATSSGASFGVVMGLQAVAINDGGAGDVAFGTIQTVTDAGGTAGSIYIGSESAAITVAGSTLSGSLVLFQLTRNTTYAGNTLPVDASLVSLELYITTNNGVDT